MEAKEILILRMVIKELRDKVKKAKLKYIELNDDRSFLVKTPIPYLVKPISRDIMSDDAYFDMIYNLNESCKFLYNTLSLLGVKKSYAIESDFTLNKITGEKLYSLADSVSFISHEYKMLIKNHKW